LYSRKLHMRVRRERTSAVTSLTILALSLGLRVENHFARRCGGGERATRGDERMETNHLALSRQKDQISRSDQRSSSCRRCMGRKTYLKAIVGAGMVRV